MFEAIKNAVKSSRQLQFDILTSFFVLQVITSISIIYYTYVNNSQTILKFSDRLVHNMSETSVNEITGRLDDVGTVLKLGDYLVWDEKEVNAQNFPLVMFMLSILQSFPYIDNIFAGTPSGNFLSLLKTAEDSKYKMFKKRLLPRGTKAMTMFINRTGPDLTESYEYMNENGDVYDRESISKDQISYDHRSRPWYELALEAREQVWTNIYVFSDPPVPGITAARPTYSRDNVSVVAVLGADMQLSTLSKILKEKKLTKESIALIVDLEGKVIAHHEILNTTKVVKGEIEILNIIDLNDPISSIAFNTFISNRKELTTFIVNAKGADYIVNVQRFPQKTFENWYYFLITPLDFFIGEVKKTQKVTFLISFIVLMLSIFIIVILAKRIARPIAALSRQAELIKNLDLHEVEETHSNIAEIQELQNAITAMRHSLISFTRFVPKRLVRKMVEKGIEVKVGGRRRKVTMFFSDIANFTTKSEGYPADKLMQHLSDYFNEMTKIISDCNGTVDKYIGDSVMAFWNAPIADKFHAKNACHAALLCQKRLDELNREWAFEGKPEFQTRIGLHTAEVIIGNLGSDERINYTIIGDGVNLASRLEGTNKIYGTRVLISEATYHDVVDYVIARPLDRIRVKGKNEPVNVYEVVAMQNTDPLIVPTKDQIDSCRRFSHAFLMYLEKNFDRAIEELNALKLEYGDDKAIELFLERCEAFKKKPPPKDWDGVTTLTTK